MGNLNQAEMAMREALLPWRGPVAMDASLANCTHSKLAALNEARVSLCEDYLERLLVHRAWPRAISLARKFLELNSCRERLWLALMWAYHASGDASRALNVYHEAARSYVNLGLETPVALRSAQVAILRNDWMPMAFSGRLDAAS
ncbi:bacterial transcriptional activator domain-containing protein [Nonomuraea sp. NPDC000554]|uniref:AfsR/SARP family transcriptional regulator n=1 Tax=Nonomuraea sp. NPDC000554 TaxID=3154259 RepID=UPI003329CEDE